MRADAGEARLFVVGTVCHLPFAAVVCNLFVRGALNLVPMLEATG